MIINNLKGKREMESELRNKLLESPLYDFVRSNWRRWEKGIGAVDLQEEDLLLYIIWGLDLFKERDEGVCQEFSEIVYSAVRRKFTRCKFLPNPEGVSHITNLVCASVLHCCSLMLSVSLTELAAYEELLRGFNKEKCRDSIDSLRDEFICDDVLLKEWMVKYMKSEMYYTSKDDIEWAIDDPQLIRRSSNKKVAKVDLFRVIMALYKLGAFESVDGKTLGPEKVFEAFGNMLGEDFSKYANNLSQGSENKGDVNIFARLSNAFDEYESEKEKRKASLR